MIDQATSKRPLLTGCLVALLVALGFSDGAFAQVARNVNVGSFEFRTNEVMNSDDVRFPRAQRSSDLDMLHVFGVVVGVRRTWSDNTGVVRPVQIAQIALSKFSDIEQVTPPVPGAFKRTFRTPYPDKVLDGTTWTDIEAAADPVDPNAPADVVVYNHLKSWTGIDIERWAYGFANEDHDDYVILEFVFTNTSGETLDDVYLAFQSETSAHTYYPADLWGNYYGATYRQFAAGDATADSLRLWYSWDGDQTSAFPTIDTRGEPDAQWGNFREPQYAGFTILHADTSPTDETDDPTQPWKAGWSQRELAPDLNVAGHADIYNYICNNALTTQECASPGWDPGNPGGYAITVDGNGNVVPGKTGPYRILDPAIGDINNTTQFDPLTEQEKTALTTFGPYTMAPGEDVRIVTALVGGQIPHRWAIDAGRAYANGNPQQFALVPLPYPIPNYNTDLLQDDEKEAMRAFTGNTVVAPQGSTLDKATKNEVLELGRALLFLNAGKALRAWKGGNVRSGQGQFDVPLAPAAPSLEGFSENDQVRLAWGNEADVDNRGGPATEYRIYREYIRPAALELPTDTTFILHATCPGDPGCSGSGFTDSNVIRGENYYYYVVGVNAQGIESSPFLNRTGTSGTKEDEALAPTRAPDDSWQDNVRVVPNPFHAQGADNYEAARRLNFLNLPAYANIHIFTMTGDRIQTIHHDGATGDQDWLRQDTFSTMEIVSGIYLYVVEELDGPRGSPTGEQAIGKFVVIK